MAPRSIALSLVISAALLSGTASAQNEPPGVPVGLPGSARSGPPAPPPIGTRMVSPVMVGIGTGLVVGGITSVVTGSVLFWLRGRDPLEMAAAAAQGPNVAAIISGGILVLIGVPLIAIGAQQRPVYAEAPMARLLPKIAPARGGGALTWTF